MTTGLWELAARSATRSPDAIAVALGGDRLTYRELVEWSERIGGALQEAGVVHGDRVLLAAGKTPRTMAALLGILRAGAAYVPLDPASPVARTRHMLDAVGTRWMLADADGAKLVRSLVSERDLTVGWLGQDEPAGLGPPAFTWATLARSAPVARSVAADGERTAYILFTSGSTGIPKGVAVRHRNVLHFVEWAAGHFGLGGEDRISSHPPLHFDLSVFDVFGAFAAGATLELVPPGLNLSPGGLAGFIRDRELTQWFSVPAALALLVKAGAVREGDFPRLRRLLWCGEVLPTPVLRALMQRLPHVRFTNLYGPTETTIASSWYTLPAIPATDDEDIPIGHAIPGEELVVLDEALRLPTVGEQGELYIGGAGVAEGYWRDETRTRAAFVPDPRPGREGRVLYRTGDIASQDPAGYFRFHGRADGQIKSRGYRIELGEIEAALATLPDLREGAVVAVETNGFEGMAICCAYVAEREVAPTALRGALSGRLPSYMLPARWMALEALPRNVNGKVDRQAIRVLFQARMGVPS
jgi:amino acid adenylation domain-containing protein